MGKDTGDSLPRSLMGIIPDRQLSIHSVTVDECAIRFRYSVFPARPPMHLCNAFEYYEWQIIVADTIGTGYHQAGGAARPEEGVMSVAPPPPSGTTELTVMIRPYGRETPSCTFVVSIYQQ